MKIERVSVITTPEAAIQKYAYGPTNNAVLDSIRTDLKILEDIDDTHGFTTAVRENTKTVLKNYFFQCMKAISHG